MKTSLRDFLESRPGYSTYSENLLIDCDAIEEKTQIKIIILIEEFGISTVDDLEFIVKHSDKVDMMLEMMRENKGWFYVINRIYRGN